MPNQDSKSPPFRASLWLEVEDAPSSYFHRRYCVWAGDFTKTQLHQGAQLIAQVFNAERVDAIDADLRAQLANVDGVLKDLVRNKKP